MKRKNQKDNLFDLPTSKDEIVDMLMDSKVSEIYKALQIAESKGELAANPDITLREAYCTDQVLGIFQKVNGAISKVIEAKAKEIRAQYEANLKSKGGEQ